MIKAEGLLVMRIVGVFLKINDNKGDKGMKKYLSILLVLSLVLSAFNVFSVSAAVPTLTVGSVEEALPGDTIEIPVTFTGNSNGICTYGIVVSYDSTYLTYTGYDLTGTIFTSSTSSPFVVINETSAGSITCGGSAIESYPGDGVLFTLKFTVNETTETNVSANISAEAQTLQYLTETYDQIEYSTLGLVVESGSVTINVSDEPVVEPDDTALGDINGSGEITANDAAVLLQYVIDNTAANDEWHVSTAVADVNGDGAVTAADAALIMDKVLDASVSFS